MIVPILPSLLKVHARLEAEFKEQADVEMNGPEVKSKKAEYRDKCKAMKELLKNGDEDGKIPDMARSVGVGVSAPSCQ